jgi:hypothetical protein
MIYQVDSKEIHHKMKVAFSDCFRSRLYPVDLEDKILLFLTELCAGSDEHSKDLKNVWKKFYPEFKDLTKSDAQWNVHLEIIFSAAALEYFCQRDQVIPQDLLPTGGLQSINDPIERESIAFQVFKLYSQHYFKIFKSKAMGDCLKVAERLEGSLNDYKTGSGATALTDKRWKYLHELTGKEFKPRTSNKKRKGTDDETKVAILENDDATHSSAGSESSAVSFKRQRKAISSSSAVKKPQSIALDQETSSSSRQIPSHQSEKLDLNYVWNVFFFGDFPSDALFNEALFGPNDFHLPPPAGTLSVHKDLDSENKWLMKNLDCTESCEYCECI